MQHSLTYSVQVAGKQTQRYVATFDGFTDAVNFADALAARIHGEGSQQSVNVWGEKSDTRVHVIYAPMAEAA